MELLGRRRDYDSTGKEPRRLAARSNVWLGPPKGAGAGRKTVGEGRPAHSQMRLLPFQTQVSADRPPPTERLRE